MLQPKKKDSVNKVSESTSVYKKKLNKKELKNIILDDIELAKTMEIKKPRAEANKIEKSLPNKETVDFFNKIKKEAGPDYFTALLKIQNKRNNPKINVGTDKGLPFSARRNFNPFTNEVNIPKGLSIEDNIEDYLDEVSHAGQPFMNVAGKFIANDIPGYIKAATLNGKKIDNLNKYVYNNPSTVEFYTHNVVKPKLVEEVNNFSAFDYQNVENKELGGYLNKNTNNNMNRYAQGGDLTQFNEGGLHSQNPLGGVPIGNNNSVEQGETKSGNFIYSNRIFLDDNTVSQYNLPKSLVGKSVADATKYIDNKFKGRNDKISQSTKNGMLSKIAEAQESMKPQEPEMEQSQMALGGFADSTIGQGFGENATGAQQSQALGAGLGVATTALDLGMTAFGKPTQNTDGLAASAPVNKGGMIASGAIKGAGAGAAFGVPGILIGGLAGGLAGLSGAGKANKAAIENSNNFALNTNKKFSDQYALGGEIDSPFQNKETWNTKKIVKYQPGVTSGKNGEQGFYIYSKDPTLGGFNPERDREFIRQENMMDLQRTPQWKEYMITQSRVQPKQMEDGGYYDKNKPYFMTNPGPINSTNANNIRPVLNPDNINEIFKVKQNLYPQDIQNLKSDNSITDSTVLKQYNNEILNPGLFDTQKVLDGDRYSFENRLKRAGETINNNAGNIARYAPIAANALQLAQLKKPQGERLDRLGNRYKPEYVDEASLQNIANQTMNNSVNAIGQSGASQGQLRSSILGSQLQRTKAISDAYSQAAAQNRATNDRAQTFNLGVDQVNLGQSNTEKENFAKDKGNYDTQKSKLIGQLGNDVGNVGKEEVYKKIAKTTTGYSWLGEYQKMNPNATPEETKAAAEKAGVLTDNTTKKALGGYLLKNKRK